MELPQAGGVRLLGDPMQSVRIGAEVRGAFQVQARWSRRRTRCCSGVCDVFAFARSDRSAASD